MIFALDARALLPHNYDKLSRIFSYILLIRNNMIVHVNLEKISTCICFQRP